MDIQSITSSVGAYSSPSPQTSQATQAQQVQPAAQEERREPKNVVERTEEAPRPVVNTSGQQTGTLINVTA